MFVTLQSFNISLKFKKLLLVTLFIWHNVLKLSKFHNVIKKTLYIIENANDALNCALNAELFAIGTISYACV